METVFYSIDWKSNCLSIKWFYWQDFSISQPTEWNEFTVTWLWEFDQDDTRLIMSYVFYGISKTKKAKELEYLHRFYDDLQKVIPNLYR